MTKLKTLVLEVYIHPECAKDKQTVLKLLDDMRTEIERRTFSSLLHEDGSKFILKDGGPNSAQYWVENEK
jgi:hypothetical protein